MTTQAERLRQQIKIEQRTFLQALIAAAALLAAGIAIGRFV
jgi:tellurite resistance protein